MTSNLASEEIAAHALQLRQEASKLSEMRGANKIGKFRNECSLGCQIVLGWYWCVNVYESVWVLIASGHRFLCFWMDYSILVLSFNLFLFVSYILWWGSLFLPTIPENQGFVWQSRNPAVLLYYYHILVSTGNTIVSIEYIY